jgi:DNA-binding PadR family transcriptional regulator
MKPVDLDIFIPLVLIKEVESFRDSYSLTKVLAWKFDIISIVDVIKNLEKHGLIIVRITNGNKYFTITNKGLEYIEVNKYEGKRLLLEKYIEEQSFINSILG